MMELIQSSLKDVGVMWSYIVEDTRKPGENHRPLIGDHYSAISLYPCSNQDHGGDKRVFNHSAIQPPIDGK